MGLDLGIAWSVRHDLNVRCMMSDYQGDTSSDIKATQNNADTMCQLSNHNGLGYIWSLKIALSRITMLSIQ